MIYQEPLAFDHHEDFRHCERSETTYRENREKEERDLELIY